MHRYHSITVFPCGRDRRPGTVTPPNGDEIPIDVLPPIWVGSRKKPPIDPPFIPQVPTGNPLKWKCAQLPLALAPALPPNERYVNGVWQQCLPCDGNDLDPAVFPWRPAGVVKGQNLDNPNPNDPGCVYPDEAACINAPCPNPIEIIISGIPEPIPSDVVPPGGNRPSGPSTGGGGPTTGGAVWHECRETIEYCPPDPDARYAVPDEERKIRSISRTCVTCSPNTVVVVNGVNTVSANPNCKYRSLDECRAAGCSGTINSEQNCLEPSVNLGTTTATITQTNEYLQSLYYALSFTTDPNEIAVIQAEIDRVLAALAAAQAQSLPVTPSTQVTSPAVASLNTNTVAQNQEITDGNLISSESIVEEEDFRETQLGIIVPKLFDPVYNFFKTTASPGVTFVANSRYLDVFNREVASEVAEIMELRESNDPWNEVTLQNLSDEKLKASINPILLNIFEYLRAAGGEVLGVSTLLSIVRQRLLEGTLDEFDTGFFREIAELQYGQNFDILQGSQNKEQSSRLAINYLSNNSNTYLNNKQEEVNNYIVNRVRPLNEDINAKTFGTKLDGSIVDITIPNNGVNVERLNPVTASVPESVGNAKTVNLGDGGGYYLKVTKLDSSEEPVEIDSILDRSYFAPGYARTKVLNMMEVDPDITITASSNENAHEFYAGDPGPSAMKPIFFGLNLSSVSGDLAGNSLVETYKASYSVIADEDQINTHVNNNALSIATVFVDYRDPIYRYALDTSTLQATLSDFNMVAFENKAFDEIGSRFVKNIPHGIILTPSRGGRYNPFATRSSLIVDGSKHVRSLRISPAVDAGIDKTPPPFFRIYNLYNEDGTQRIGVAETESYQNIGYKYFEEDFTQTFYSASARDYLTSTLPVSSGYGMSYMLREVIDYLSATYNTNKLTWYDVFTRMPATRMGEMFSDGSGEFMYYLSTGFRNGIEIRSLQASENSASKVLPDDERTIITARDRKNVSTSRL